MNEDINILKLRKIRGGPGIPKVEIISMRAKNIWICMKLKNDLTLPKLEAMSAPSAPDCNLKVIKNRHHPPCRYYQNLNFQNLSAANTAAKVDVRKH